MHYYVSQYGWATIHVKHGARFECVLIALCNHVVVLFPHDLKDL